ncbi:hypothetical protein [Mycobacteroides abscessus]|uniref:hypothetical protein n=1 Tax=Mycobacteroides abscessus TaxID=36809 RepID=UPI0009A88348|nr:Uncharacterised protein [Mycobacteroides abscessus subsp. bolletii]
MGDNRMSENTTLPVHPITGLQAIGFTRRGPVWPVMGASEPPAEGTETEPQGGEQQQESAEGIETEPQDGEQQQHSGEGTETEPQGGEPQQQSAVLPDDHPLVKTLEANKTEIRQLRAKVQRLAEAEAEAAQVPSRVAGLLKGHVVSLHQIDGEDAELFLTADEPELLLKQVTRLLSREGKQGRPNHVPGEGTNGRVKPSSMQQFFDELSGQTS